MKKLLALLCILGIALPYYNIYKFIEANDWEWSTPLFFEQINLNYAMKILNADLTLAATTFLVFLVFKLKTKDLQIKQFFKYFASLFLVGFSLALPLYFYDNYNKWPYEIFRKILSHIFSLFKLFVLDLSLVYRKRTGGNIRWPLANNNFGVCHSN